MRWLMVVAALSACTTTDSKTTERMTPVEMCGRPPLAPGFSVGYPGDGTAVLPAAEMQSISQFLNTDYESWAACIDSIK